MSKLDITQFLEKDVTPKLIGDLVDTYHAATQELPKAIVVTEEQWHKFFFSAGEKLTNFRGIPLESPTAKNELETVLKTINSILSGLHVQGARDVTDVYRLLEGMKTKLTEGK